MAYNSQIRKKTPQLCGRLSGLSIYTLVGTAYCQAISLSTAADHTSELVRHCIIERLLSRSSVGMDRTEITNCTWRIVSSGGDVVSDKGDEVVVR